MMNYIETIGGGEKVKGGKNKSVWISLKKCVWEKVGESGLRNSGLGENG